MDNKKENASLKPETVLKNLVPLFNKLGWKMEYRFNTEMQLHTFYTYPLDGSRTTGNIRTASKLSMKTISLFKRELREIALNKTI